jgi:RNA polymerase sigma-70 factor (ECF subfamily)
VAVDVEDLYRRYGPMVLRRCRQMLSDEQLALDAMQDTFVQILRRRDRLDDRGLSSLLYLTATNTCLNRLRSRRRKPQESAGDLLERITSTTDETERVQARSILARLLGNEPPSTATIAVLHLYDGMTLEETANAVGLSVSGVRRRLRKLKGLLQELEDAR